MQKYTYSPSLVVQCGNSTYCYPTIVDACSSYVGSKGFYIQKNSTETGFIPFVATSSINKSTVRVATNSSTTCALEVLSPNAYFCATACSCAYVSNSYDPGTFTTYIKGFTFCYRDPNHSNCPFALRCSYDVCLYTSGIGWKYMGSMTCGCWKITASTYQFTNNCIANWRCTGVYLFDGTYCKVIGSICTYMPSRPSAGQTKCCSTNCNGTFGISEYVY